MIKILRIEGWVLNPNDKQVNGLLKAIERNNGECACSSNTSEDKHCPCSSYREGKGCCCGLYKYKGIKYKACEGCNVSSLKVKVNG